MVLDGEIVAFDAAGRPSFESLQRRAGLEGGRASRPDASIAVAFVAFDLPYLDGRSLLRAAYPGRREALDELALTGENWMTPPSSIGAGNSMLEASRQHGIEGVVAKRLDSRYEAGERSGAWLKIKLQRRHAFVIGGWVPGEAGLTGSLGALVIGYHDGGRLICVGSVGTGFSDVTRRKLLSLLAPTARTTSPFQAGQAPPTTRFIEPRLVCEVEFTEMTARGGQLRHPSYKGLRPDLTPEAVTLAEWARPSRG